MKFLLRRVFHATETEKKKAERYTTNTIFKSDYESHSLKILSVPDMIENVCSMPNCSNPAFCMVDFGNENFRTMCIDHLRQQFPDQKLCQEKCLMVPSIEQAVKGNAFEWQPQGKNDNWYKIRGGNISPDSQQRLSKKEIKDRFNDIMSKVLEDEPQLLDGEYQKEDKKLVILV
jgi:hypothetical protein